MFSLPISIISKNALIDIFETLTHFPDIMMIKSGDYTVDAHSLMGVFSLDINKPTELILDKEPTEELKNAMSRFSPVSAAV
jgi:phosphotransferase system HPr-like phosphotransfer protein